jgi:hypothetical protein
MINSGTLTIGSALLNATGTIALAGGTITGTIATGIAGTHWVAFLPGAEIPGDLSGTFKLYLSLAYTINGVDLPPQTTLYRVSDDYIAPDDAIVFPEPGLTIKLNVTISGGTPTPTPTPAE